MIATGTVRSPWVFRIVKVTVLVFLTAHLIVTILHGAKTVNAWMELISSAQGIGESTETSPRHSDTSTLMALTSAPGIRIDQMAGNEENLLMSDFVFVKDPQFQDIRAPLFHEQIPLEELAATNKNPSGCPNSDTFDISPFLDTVLSESITHPPGRFIPKVVHLTGKTRCLTGKVSRNLELWRFQNYSVFFHDDVAVDRLLEKYFPAFPHLQIAKECSISGAAKADIWRYLVLWEYGGVYTDIDNAPGDEFANGTAIHDNDEAWFVVERQGILSQYFMASSPKHPIMYVAMMQCLSRLIKLVENIGDQYVPFITGPGVTKAAMVLFMKNETFEEVQEGRYTGLNGRTVTVKGSRKKSNRIIYRESVTGKSGHYNAMGMKHFSSTKNKTLTESCYEYLFQLSQKRLKEEDAAQG